MKKQTQTLNQPSVILATLALVLLLVGVIASLFLGSRTQDSRQQAQVVPTTPPVICTNSFGSTTQNDSCDGDLIGVSNSCQTINGQNGYCQVNSQDGQIVLCDCIEGEPTASPICSVIFNVAEPTATPSSSPTSSPSFTPTPSPTNTPTSTPSFTPTPTPSFSPTPSPTFTPTPSPSNTPTPSPSFTPTPSPSYTPTATPTNSATPSPFPTPSELPEAGNGMPTMIMLLSGVLVVILGILAMIFVF